MLRAFVSEIPFELMPVSSAIRHRWLAPFRKLSAIEPQGGIYSLTDRLLFKSFRRIDSMAQKFPYSDFFQAMISSRIELNAKLGE